MFTANEELNILRDQYNNINPLKNYNKIEENSNLIFESNYVKFSDEEKQKVLGEINDNLLNRKDKYNSLFLNLKNIILDVAYKMSYEEEEYLIEEEKSEENIYSENNLNEKNVTIIINPTSIETLPVDESNLINQLNYNKNLTISEKEKDNSFKEENDQIQMNTETNPFISDRNTNNSFQDDFEIVLTDPYLRPKADSAFGMQQLKNNRTFRNKQKLQKIKSSNTNNTNNTNKSNIKLNNKQVENKNNSEIKIIKNLIQKIEEPKPVSVHNKPNLTNNDKRNTRASLKQSFISIVPEKPIKLIEKEKNIQNKTRNSLVTKNTINNQVLNNMTKNVFKASNIKNETPFFKTLNPKKIEVTLNKRKSLTDSILNINKMVKALHSPQINEEIKIKNSNLCENELIENIKKIPEEPTEDNLTKISFLVTDPDDFIDDELISVNFVPKEIRFQKNLLDYTSNFEYSDIESLIRVRGSNGRKYSGSESQNIPLKIDNPETEFDKSSRDVNCADCNTKCNIF